MIKYSFDVNIKRVRVDPGEVAQFQQEPVPEREAIQIEGAISLYLSSSYLLLLYATDTPQ